MKKIIFMLIFLPIGLFANETEYGNWKVKVELKNGTDTKLVTMTGIDESKSVALKFKCDSVLITPDPKVQISSGMGSVEIFLKVDDNEPVKIKWMKFGPILSIDEKILVNNLIQDGNKLFVGIKMQPSGKYPTFSLTGYKEAYKNLEKECKSK